MAAWLPNAIDFIESWITHQMEQAALPGCAIAIVHRGEIVFDKAWGHADLGAGEALTPRHRFRIASHSKTFTAAGILRLRDLGRLGLDDPVGRHVGKLHPAVAEATIADVLSHSAGLVRDGANSGQFMDRRPWLTREEVLADLRRPQPLAPGERFKYSNHGFALAGLIIEAVTGEPYESWMAREIVAASGLKATTPDLPQPMRAPFARGHSQRLADGSRLVIPASDPTNAIAAAGGFVATAADVARFFASLSPRAAASVLAVASRREMIRRRVSDREGALPWHYGLGAIVGPEGDFEWFGHSGSFQGTLSRTVVVPAEDIAVSVMTNSLDGLALVFTEGTLGVLKTLKRRGAPSRAARGWGGTYWGLWGPVTLVPAGDVALVAAPAAFAPLHRVPEIEPRRAGRGLIARGSGFGSPGEEARLVSDAKGRVKEFWLGGAKFLPRRDFEAEMRARYAGKRKRRG